MNISFSSILISAALLIASAANATPIFDNGSATDNVGGYCASCGAAGEYTMFDDFTLANSYNDLVVEWDASFFHADDTSIQIGIWANENSGLLYSTTVSFLNNDYATVNKNENWGKNITTAFTLNNVNLSSGTYWLSLSGDDMHFSTSFDGNGSQVHSSNIGNGSSHDGLAIPFRLYGASSSVPEPSSLLLLALGIFGLGARRLAKK